MTFDEAYPGAPDWFQPPAGPWDDGVVKAGVVAPCWNCQLPTAYVDFGFQAHLCSERCRDVKWAEYFRARTAPPPEGPA